MVNSAQAAAHASEGQRERLRRLAERLLGSPSEADDAVQAAWLRLRSVDGAEIENVAGWLTTVTSRICLDMLRARRSRRETPQQDAAQLVVDERSGSDPERDLLLAESVGVAMLVVLDRLAPAERVAFVLHDMFGVPFVDIARALERTPETARQLASRARRRVRGSAAPAGTAHPMHALAVKAFYVAAREGDFDALLQLLSPDVALTVQTDDARAPLQIGRGTSFVARRAAMGAARARPAAVMRNDDRAVIVHAPAGRPVLVMLFQTEGGRITQVDIVTHRSRLETMVLTLDPGTIISPRHHRVSAS